MQAVGDLIREVAATAILPLFQRLADADVRQKAPGELVTVADQRAEEMICNGLLGLLPGSVVVGEESVAADPALLGHLRDTGAVWLVDPLDGTSNFAAGHGPFAVMVALLHDGVPAASWIFDPLDDRLAVAESGSGAYVDGVRVSAPDEALPMGEVRGAMPTRFLPPRARAAVEQRVAGLGQLLPGQHCAGREYPDIVAGVQHFVLFWRTLPWDHVPGTLFLREAGGVALRFDGSAYDPADERHGLLVAANESIWQTVRDTVLVDL